MKLSYGFRKCFKLFFHKQMQLFMEFLEVLKYYPRKITQKITEAWWSLGLLMFQGDVYKAQPNNFDGAFLRKQLTGKIR